MLSTFTTSAERQNIRNQEDDEVVGRLCDSPNGTYHHRHIGDLVVFVWTGWLAWHGDVLELRLFIHLAHKTTENAIYGHLKNLFFAPVDWEIESTVGLTPMMKCELKSHSYVTGGSQGNTPSLVVCTVQRSLYQEVREINSSTNITLSVSGNGIVLDRMDIPFCGVSKRASKPEPILCTGPVFGFGELWWDETRDRIARLSAWVKHHQTLGPAYFL